MVAAAGLISKVILGSMVFLGTMKLVLIPESMASWEARSLYRLRCGGGPGEPFEFGLMTSLGKPTWKGVWELCTCRDSRDTGLMALRISAAKARQLGMPAGKAFPYLQPLRVFRYPF